MTDADVDALKRELRAAILTGNHDRAKSARTALKAAGVAPVDYGRPRGVTEASNAERAIQREQQQHRIARS